MKPKRQKEKGTPLSKQVAEAASRPPMPLEKVSLHQLRVQLLADIERLRQRKRDSFLRGVRTRSSSTGHFRSVYNGALIRSYDPFQDPVFQADVARMSFDQKMALQRLYQTTGQLIGRRNPFFSETSGGKTLSERRVGGVMTDHAKPIPGLRVIVATSDQVVNTSVQSVTAYQTILSNVFSTRGNHKTPNPHRFTVRKIDYGSGRSFAGDSKNNTVVSGSQAVSLGLSASFADLQNFVYNKALSRAYESIRGDTDLSVDAIQAKQSGLMLNQRFQQGRDVFLSKAPKALLAISKIVNAMKRSNPRDWGSLWLEWTYGWKPLAGSVFGAAENMILASSASSSGVSGHPVNASASEKGDSRTTKSFVEEGVYLTQTVNSVFQCRIKAFYALTSGGLNGVAGYTSLNPVSIAWERAPYSFVADWIVDIGGYLRNMESGLLYGSDFCGGYQTERSKKTVLETYAGSHSQYFVEAAGSSETKTFARSVLSSSPLPRAPSFNPKLGVSRLISAASLLSQQLHSLKHKR